MSEASSFPGVSRLICLASKKYPRYSEGDVIGLKDGRLLLALGRKEGASDFAKGTLIGLYSSDGGLTWDDEPHVIREPSGDRTDLMSVSFCRTPRGVHLFYLGRGKDAKRDTLVFQMISTDEGKTWGEPTRVSVREGYHIVNNARVIRTKSGRLLVPAAYVPDNTDKRFDHQRVFVLRSDDEGVSWRESNELALESKPLMEPGVAECADGSVYMTIRTAVGTMYEARSHDGGETWGELRSTGLVAPAAPSTVTRAPGSEDLWLFWCDRPGNSSWKGRSRQVVAVSKDHGRTWGKARPIEDDAKHSYGYISVTVVGGQVLLTYYDWADHGQAGFLMTNLRERMIPLGWFKGEVVPPVFGKGDAPVLQEVGRIVSVNSGVVEEESDEATKGRSDEGKKLEMWYTRGEAEGERERMAVYFAESEDGGRSWKRGERVWPGEGEAGSFYHASVHRMGKGLAAYVWRKGEGADSALWRYVAEDGRTFVQNPRRALMALQGASEELQRQAGEGRISNDAFDVIRNADGTWEYFAAHMERASDARMVVKEDNAAGLVRLIGRATSGDGVNWSEVEVVLRPDYGLGDAYDTQFYGMQVFRYRGFYLGLLQVFHVKSQTIGPEWAWSHDGINWVRTRVPCISLGDEGAFDSRMILFGSVLVGEDEIVWIYSGYDWRHNAYRKGEVASAIGRAVVSRKELDRWLDTLPLP